MSDVNYLAIVIAGLSSLALGFLWYGPIFGKKWMGYIGKTEEELQADFSPLVYVWSLLLALVMAFMLAVLINWTAMNSLGGGLHLGLLVGVGFTFIPFVINNLYEKEPIGLVMINSLYHVMLLAVMGAIIGAW